MLPAQEAPNQEDSDELPPMRTPEQLLDEYPMIDEIKHPSRVVIYGKSRSGKTTLGEKMAEWLIPQVDEVIIASPSYLFQSVWDPIRLQQPKYFPNMETAMVHLKKEIGEEIMEKMDQTRKAKPLDTRRLIILDDVSSERSLNQGNKGFFNGLVYNAFHFNISILLMCHNIRNVGAGLRENSEAVILFNAQNNEEIDDIHKIYSLVPDVKSFRRFFQKVIKDPIASEEEKHPFILYLPNKQEIYYMMREKLNVTNESDSEE